MRILFLAAALIAPGTALATPPLVPVKFTPLSAANCPTVGSYQAKKSGKGPKAQKLGALPPGGHYKAVYRTVGGCSVPVMADFRPANGRR
jgi:hypothetical protein